MGEIDWRLGKHLIEPGDSEPDTKENNHRTFQVAYIPLVELTNERLLMAYTYPCIDTSDCIFTTEQSILTIMLDASSLRASFG
jgi:hypothetical protein